MLFLLTMQGTREVLEKDVFDVWFKVQMNKVFSVFTS